MLSNDPVPTDVLRDYGQAACLCRLPHLDEEGPAVHDVIFGTGPVVGGVSASLPSLAEALDDTSEAMAQEEGGAVLQRRRSFAHYLTVLSSAPAVVDDTSAFREALWSSPVSDNEGHALVVGRWAALIAK